MANEPIPFQARSGEGKKRTTRTKRGSSTGRRAGIGGRRADPILDAQALEYRAQGYSYPEIAEKQGTSHSTAQERCKRAMRMWIEPHAEELAAQESLKLYKLEQVYYPLALAGDYDAFNAELKIMERRAKLFGLDAPKKFDIRQLVVNWAMDNGLDPDETLQIVAGGYAGDGLLPEE